LFNIPNNVSYCTSLVERELPSTRKASPPILTASILKLFLLTSSLIASTIFVHNAAYAQNSNTGFGDTTYLALPNGKSIPIKYIINTGKLLGLVLDKSRATLDVILSSTSADNGNLTIQIPRDVVDNKKEGNADAPFRVHVDGKDATVRETDNSKITRTLSIQFNKDAKVIDIIGSKSTVQ
jgi:hypothetical protein